MPEIRILAERVTHSGRQLIRGDLLEGKAKNLKPLVDSRAAEWTDPPDGEGMVSGFVLGDLTVSEVRDLVAKSMDPVTLREVLRAEQRHPKYTPNGRKGVRTAIEERLLELTEAHDAD